MVLWESLKSTTLMLVKCCPDSWYNTPCAPTIPSDLITNCKLLWMIDGWLNFWAYICWSLWKLFWALWGYWMYLILVSCKTYTSRKCYWDKLCHKMEIFSTDGCHKVILLHLWKPILNLIYSGTINFPRNIEVIFYCICVIREIPRCGVSCSSGSAV